MTAASVSSPRDGLRGPRLRRFLLWLGGVALVGYLLGATPWGAREFVPRFTHVLAVISSWPLQLLGYDARVTGITLHGSNASLEIVNLCNGYFETVLLLAGLAALAPRWTRYNAAVVGVALLALWLFNSTRIVSLYLIQIHWPSQFEAAHTQWWQGLFFLGVLGIFYLAMNRFRDESSSTSA